MTATLVKDAGLERVGSHSVSLGVNYHDEIEKEECFGYFSATWRGEPCRVEVSADRYRHSSGLSEWRVYARAAYSGEDRNRHGADRLAARELTDTARHRLGELCVPIMREWLDSDDYGASRRQAFVRMFKRQASDLSIYAERPSDRLTSLVTKYADEISLKEFDALLEAGYRFDAYVQALNAIDA